MDALQVSDDAAAAAQKTPHRVTLKSIQDKILVEEFFHPAASPQMTICALTLNNGFTVVGQSAPADAGNFDAALGRRFAREDALRQIWPLEGYALRLQLHNAEG